MRLSAAQLLLAGAAGVMALPHQDSPRQRLLNGLELPQKLTKAKPYTPEHRDPYDNAVDAIGDDLDPLPWRNGLGASVLGPWNRDRSRQNPDLVRPPTTDSGNLANMRWSFADSHIRIEVPLLEALVRSCRLLTLLNRRAAGRARPPFGNCPAVSSCMPPP